MPTRGAHLARVFRAYLPLIQAGHVPARPGFFEGNPLSVHTDEGVINGFSESPTRRAGDVKPPQGKTHVLWHGCSQAQRPWARDPRDPAVIKVHALALPEMGLQGKHDTRQSVRILCSNAGCLQRHRSISCQRSHVYACGTKYLGQEVAATFKAAYTFLLYTVIYRNKTLERLSAW